MRKTNNIKHVICIIRHFETYCDEFVNIICKISKYYLFLYDNISDALKTFIFGEKSHEFS